MGKPTTGQALQLMAVLANNTPWDLFSAGDLQKVIDSPRESGAAFTAWLNNGCRLSVKGPNTLTVDRLRPFNPAAFIGRGWTIEEQDERSLALTEIDFGTIRFTSGLKLGENSITGEEKLKRLKKEEVIRLDAKIGQALYEEKGQVTLRLIHEHHNISWFELAGSVLRYSDGNRCFLYLYRSAGGSWDWCYYWLGYDRDGGRVSPVLAS